MPGDGSFYGVPIPSKKRRRKKLTTKSNDNDERSIFNVDSDIRFV